jgi:hypothetical protein
MIKARTAITSFVALLWLYSFHLPGVLYGQTLANRVVNQGRGNIEDPVRIVGILVGDKPIKHNIPFSADSSWLDHLTVQVQNVSNKNLVAGTIQMDFREIGPPTMFFMIQAGQIPDHQLYSNDGQKVTPRHQQAPAMIKPGQILNIRVAPFYSDLSSILIERTDLASVRACTIDDGAFYFDDGTRWSHGNFSKEDGTTPGKYDRISAGEFSSPRK